MYFRKGRTEMSTIMITIETSNAAFEDYPAGEVSRILQELARDVRDRELAELDGRRLRDVNGHTVGRVTVEK